MDGLEGVLDAQVGELVAYYELGDCCWRNQGCRSGVGDVGTTKGLVTSFESVSIRTLGDGDERSVYTVYINQSSFQKPSTIPGYAPPKNFLKASSNPYPPSKN